MGMGYLNSWLPTPESQNNADLSWLPNYNDNDPHHQHTQNTDSDDDSWLPSYNNSKSCTSNASRKPDSHDSWLPSASIDINKNRNDHHTLPTPHNFKSNSFKPSSSSNVIHNGDRNKETNNNNHNNHNCHNKPSNHWERAREAAACSGVDNRDKNKETNNRNNHPNKPSSHAQWERAREAAACSVETHSLGGVSTLLRRWKDAESKNSNRKSCISNSNQKERIQVGDVIKKNKSVVGENKCVSVTIGKPHLIRGRQTFIAFFNMVEQDKRRELESLTQRKYVSMFPNQARIQALLRVRLIRIRAENQKEAKSNKHSVSETVKSIWDKLSTGVKQDIHASRKEMNKSNTSTECFVDRSPIGESTATTTTTPTATTETSSPETVSTVASPQSAQEVTHSNILVPNTEVYQSKCQYPSGLENCYHWVKEHSQTQSDWDEEEDHYYNHNWVNDIARPLSDWECMRRIRYQEMLHANSYNQDIQQLLERKSVSGFLSSDQRNILDQLVVSCVQRVSKTDSTKKEESHVRQRRRNNTSQSSSIKHPSIEMELINDLRTYVVQVHKEVMELRKVVTSCVKNQYQSIQKRRSDCSVCYAMQADSFLYRCGHMCTCYDCGLELRNSNGKCPVCNDLILDVVRACAG